MDEDFCGFMEKRARRIEKGLIGHVRVLTGFVNRKKMDEVVKIAEQEARANPSDPFVRNRVVSHLREGLNRRSDYEMNWGRIKTPTAMSVAFQAADVQKHTFRGQKPVLGETYVSVAMNHTVPCL